MKLRGIFILALLSAIFLFHAHPALADLGDFFKGATRILGGEGELSDGKITKGLKEALEIGTKNAVDIVSKLDGYYKNPKVKIPLPKAIRKVEKVLRVVGYGPQVDAFELSMNRAAEKAAPKATSLFWNALKEMTFSDARKILKGRDNEATLYFKDKTSDTLSKIFKPIVHKAMSAVGVTRKYQDLDAMVRSTALGKGLRFDLDEYVTDGALKGLFYMLAEEEKKIRKNPAARITKLLKEVFGR
ncbi:MAG: DUF4197 domain-containing protein [Deltaproteobacteria bacterium]|nr:DUF4197 domain-containing protein [Deltaproteobacteria bacterium]